VLWWHEGGKRVFVPADRFFCERKLLESVRAKPSRNPLQGLKPTDRIRPPEPKPGAEVPAGKWFDLFDGKTLKGWTVVRKFADPGPVGEVRAEDGQIILDKGLWSGMAWSGAFPTKDYEVDFEVMRVEGESFVNLTVPVGETHVRVVIGGWGNKVGGLDLVDGKYAKDNETSFSLSPDTGQWYRVRVVVSHGQIRVWVDDQKVVDFKIAGHRLGLNAHGEPMKPFGIAASLTKVAIRNMRFRRVSE